MRPGGASATVAVADSEFRDWDEIAVWAAEVVKAVRP